MLRWRAASSLKNAWPSCGNWYAGAVVAHLHFQSVSCAAQADVNRPMAMALGVVQQVAQQQLDVGTVKL